MMKDFSSPLPEGLSESACARWASSLGPAGQRWLQDVGGYRMTQLTDERAFSLALLRAAEIPALFGFGYARLIDIMSWHFDPNQRHPFVYLHTRQMDDAHKDAVSANRQLALDRMKAAEDVAAACGVELPVFFQALDRTALLAVCEQAPTAFILGFAIGHIVLGDWDAEMAAA